MPHPVLAVVGPTATGKSDLALDVVDLLGGPDAAEVVNADAMQLYRGMDVGTAKLPPDQRRGVAHHQLDVLDVTQEANVAAYQREARADVAAVHGRGRRAVLVGGSGLYVRAALDELDFPGTDPQVRARLEERVEREGPGILHAELAARDPQAAARILPANARRVVRALEVIELTGRPYSASMPEHRYHLPAVQVAIAVPREELDRRIAARARAMLDGGLLEETRDLLAAGLAQGRTASRAVGYSQAVAVLEGRLDVDEAHEAITIATRQLARRQEKWFRRDPRVRWLEPGPDLAARAAQAFVDGAAT
ncbi:tRNA (adenosine(37)-N6)-dimethylallyltransferase MiaA [Georgenia sp. 311]|uniref:tRNA dimethylallyltransferase n=1 Tax=Georgenia wutianyii TaxID=2585135 RepID=A0ABX5VLT0_9MICO|nr:MULTISPECIES: tRNA (adenosine(37)-N6)-dimethylallyltransferase MiaA [Georgenia]QDB78838.1 tRNA (adenosine(37)-N6)-dimethylallyltransferase MiaA [Georgenia wutianyii]TNC16698.1 tRNA (adenosine(37)-N6)-dimethylallyltransferase MiaA [Georgenia sp. 311]